MNCVAVGLLFSMSATAHAALIDYTYTGIGSGSLNGVPFSGADFTITARADTANVVTTPTGRIVTHDTCTIQVAGMPAVTPLFPTTTAYNYVNSGLVFGGEGVALYRFVAPSWNVDTDFGPMSLSGNLLQWISGRNTSGGLLDFNDANDIPGTFQARIVPAPGAAVALCLPLLARRRRKPAC